MGSKLCECAGKLHLRRYIQRLLSCCRPGRCQYGRWGAYGYRRRRCWRRICRILAGYFKAPLQKALRRGARKAVTPRRDCSYAARSLLCFFSLEFLTDFTVAGAKALNILAGAARLNSCPDTRQELVVGAADRATIVKDWRRWLTKAGVRDAAFG
jgi:hypothetical protein